MSRKAELINETNPPSSPRRSSRIAQVLTTIKSDPKPTAPRTRRASVGSDAEDSTPVRRRRSSVDKELPRKEKKSTLDKQPSLESITETSFSKNQENVEPLKERDATPKALKHEKKFTQIAKFNLETIDEASVGENPDKEMVEAPKEKNDGKGLPDAPRLEKTSAPTINVIEATPAKNVAKVEESVPVVTSGLVTEKEDLNSSKSSSGSKVPKESITVEASVPVTEKEDLNISKNSQGSKVLKESTTMEASVPVTVKDDLNLSKNVTERKVLKESVMVEASVPVTEKEDLNVSKNSQGSKVLKESVTMEASVPVAVKHDLNLFKNVTERKVLKKNVTVEASVPVTEKEDLNVSKNSQGSKVSKESITMEASVPVTVKDDLNSSKNVTESKVLKESVMVEASVPVTEKEDLNSSKNSNGSDKENIDFPTEESQTKRVSNVFRPKSIRYSFEEPMEVDVTVDETEVTSEDVANETMPFSIVNENSQFVPMSSLSEAVKNTNVDEALLETKQKPTEDTQVEKLSTINMQLKEVDNQEKISDVQNQSPLPEDVNCKQLSIDLKRHIPIVLEKVDNPTKEKLNIEHSADTIAPVEKLEKIETLEYPADITHADPKRKSSLHVQQNEVKTVQPAEVIKEIPEHLPQNEGTDSKKTLNETISDIKEDQLIKGKVESVEEFEKALQPEKIPKPIDDTNSNSKISNVSGIKSLTETQQIEKLDEPGQLESKGKHEEEQLHQINSKVEQDNSEPSPSNDKMSYMHINNEKQNEPVREVEIEKKLKEEQSQQINDKIEQNISELPPSNTKNAVRRNSSGNSENLNDLEKEEKLEEKSKQIVGKVEQEIPELPPSEAKIPSIKRKRSDSSEKPNKQEKEKKLEDIPQQIDGKVAQKIPGSPPSNIETSSMKRKISDNNEVDLLSSDMEDKEEFFELKISAEECSATESPLEEEMDEEAEEDSLQVRKSKCALKVYSSECETLEIEVKNAVSNDDEASPRQDESEERVEKIVNCENLSLKLTASGDTDHVEMVKIEQSTKTKSMGHINFKSTTEILRDEKKDTKMEEEIAEGIASGSATLVSPKPNRKKRVLPQSPDEVPKKKKKETSSPIVLDKGNKITEEVAGSNLETKVVKRIRPTTIIRDNLNLPWYVEFDELGLQPSITNI